MSSTNSLSAVSPTAQGSGTVESRNKTRKNVSSACRACKARKLKCSGISPCETCVRTKQECIINAEGDQRRKLNLKRKMDSLEDDRQFLLRLLDTLRTGQEAHVTELINYVRSLASFDDIKIFLNNMIKQTENGQIPQLTGSHVDLEPLQHARERPTSMLAVRRLADTPLITVPAHPWTTVTDDDALISHLISLWLTWHYPWFHGIDQAMLIEHMQSKDLHSALCSPFLVNAILADACFLSDYPEACAVPGDIRTKGDHYYAEAKKLLDAEEGRISIPTIQGLRIMFECACVMGKDRAGWVYTTQAADGMRLLRQKKARLILETGLSTTDLELLIDRIELSHFNLFASSSLAFHIPPQVNKPQNIRLSTHCDVDWGQWVPYPNSEGSLPAHNDCILDTSARLGDVVWDMASFMFREERAYTQADLVSAVQEWHARLAACWEMRSRCIDCDNHPVPGTLTLHMYYHTIIITMYAFLKTLPPNADNRVKQWAERARQTCLSSAHVVSQLTEIQQTRWGPDPGPVANGHFIAVSLYILMEDLKSHESHRAFMSLCKAHIRFAHRWPLHRGTSRMVQLTAQRMKDPLPHDVVAHFREFEERCWKPDSGRQFSSRYPNFAIAIRQRINTLPDDLEMDAFLEKWINLDDEPRME